MKITYCDEGSFARIWLTGPFWQFKKSRLIAEAGIQSAPVRHWRSLGLTFQITLAGSNPHILRAYKAIINEQRRINRSDANKVKV